MRFVLFCFILSKTRQLALFLLLCCVFSFFFRLQKYDNDRVCDKLKMKNLVKLRVLGLVAFCDGHIFGAATQGCVHWWLWSLPLWVMGYAILLRACLFCPECFKNAKCEADFLSRVQSETMVELCAASPPESSYLHVCMLCMNFMLVCMFVCVCSSSVRTMNAIAGVYDEGLLYSTGRRNALKNKNARSSFCLRSKVKQWLNSVLPSLRNHLTFIYVCTICMNVFYVSMHVCVWSLWMYFCTYTMNAIAGMNDEGLLYWEAKRAKRAGSFECEQSGPKAGKLQNAVHSSTQAGAS